MEEVFNINLDKLKKEQVSKIKKCVVDLIQENKEYYENKKYAHRVMKDEVSDFNRLKKRFNQKQSEIYGNNHI